MRIGSAIGRGPPLIGSGRVVSPEAISSQPLGSSAFVKKSPSGRSWPVATQVVPPWQTVLFWWIGPCEASTVSIDLLPVAFETCVEKIRMLTVWQSGSASRSVSYQVTATRPGSPAATHGQMTRLFEPPAIVIGVDHDLPWSRE